MPLNSLNILEQITPEIMEEWEKIQATPSRTDDIQFIMKHAHLSEAEAERFLGFK